MADYNDVCQNLKEVKNLYLKLGKKNCTQEKKFSKYVKSVDVVLEHLKKDNGLVYLLSAKTKEGISSKVEVPIATAEALLRDMLSRLKYESTKDKESGRIYIR